jgi:hypothetical protein
MKRSLLFVLASVAASALVATGNPLSNNVTPAILISGDAINWSTLYPGGTGGLLGGITCGRNQSGPLFVVVSSFADVLTSADGTNWIARNCGAWSNLVGVTYGDGEVSQFVAVGTQDLIVEATFSVTTPFSYSPLTGAQLPIFDLPFGRIISIQSSSDLVNWSLLTNFFLSRNTPSLLISDPSTTNHSQGFYSIGFR